MGIRVEDQQCGQEAEDVLPVHFVSLQHLLQMMEQVLHTEDYGQLYEAHARTRTDTHTHKMLAD